MSRSHLSILSSLNIENIDDCLKLYIIYYDINKKNENKYKNQIYNIKYQDILQNPNSTINKLFNYLEINVDSNKLNKIIDKFDSSKIESYKKEKLIFDEELLKSIQF